MRFDLTSRVNSFNAAFGVGGRVLSAVFLRLAGNFSVQGSQPNNAVINPVNAGLFEGRDGTGRPSPPVRFKPMTAARSVWRGGWTRRAFILQFAAAHGAGVVVGRIPVLRGKMDARSLEILVQGDPAMRRPYVVLEASPAKVPRANAAGDCALAGWLTGEAGRAFLHDFGVTQPDGFPCSSPPSGPGRGRRLIVPRFDGPAGVFQATNTPDDDTRAKSPATG